MSGHVEFPEFPESPDVDDLVASGQVQAVAGAPLSRNRITWAAIEFIDEHGLSGLTMRRLGDVLDVEAMSLYRYMPDKESLLDAVVEMTIAEMSLDAAGPEVHTDGWQHFLRQVADSVRRETLRHPKVFPLVASRPLEAPWLRPPLRSLAWVEAFLATLLSEGFSDASAIASYRAFSSFLIGHLLLEASTLGADAGPLDIVTEATAKGGLRARYPTVRRLRNLLVEDHAAVEFQESLEALLVRISRFRGEGVDRR